MRVHLARPLSRTWLDHEAPATSIQTVETLNGPGSITLTLPTDYVTQKAADGLDTVLEWGTLVVVEDDQDRIIQAGIVDQITPGPTTTQVDAGGVSMVLTGAPWQGEAYSLIEKPAADVMRMLWAEYQSHPAGALGVTVTGSAPKVIVGVDSTTAWKTANTALKSAQDHLANAQSEQKTATSRTASDWARIFHACGLSRIGTIKKGQTPPKGTAAELNKVLWLNTRHVADGHVPKPGVVEVYNPTAKEWFMSDPDDTATTIYKRWEQDKVWEKNAKAVTAAAKEKVSAAKEKLDALSEQAAQPYAITWWDTQDLSAVAGDMVTAGLEWAETATWDGNTLDLGISVRVPGGIRRDTLRFEIGVNIQAAPALAVTDPYTDVYVLGGGEGSKTVHTTTRWDAGPRVRRVKVVTDQDQKTTARTQTLAARELAKVRGATGPALEQVEVRDHPFARWQQYGVGDLIRIIGTMPGGWDLDAYYRVTERTMSDTTDKVTLKVEVTE